MTNNRRFILIYDADQTIRGEVSYFVGHALGKLNCSLCDITHGPVFQKRAWKAWLSEMTGRGHDLQVIHRNQMAESLRTFVAGRLACVVTDTNGTFEMVLTPEALAQCNGQISALTAVLEPILIGLER